MNALRRWLPRFSLTTLLLSCMWLSVWLWLNLGDSLWGEHSHFNPPGWPVQFLYKDLETFLISFGVENDGYREITLQKLMTNLLCGFFGLLLIHGLIDRPDYRNPTHVPDAAAERQQQGSLSGWSVLLITLWLALATLVIHFREFQFWPSSAATIAIAALLWLLIDRPFRSKKESNSDSPPAR